MDVGLKLCVVFLLMAFAVGCPDNSRRFPSVPGVCFSYHPGKLNFEDATAYCNELGGMMIEIRDDARRGIVSQMTDQQIWMGLRRDDDPNSPWMWQGSDLALTDTNSYWRGFQSSRADKACVNTFKKDQCVWAAQRCGTKRSFICETKDTTITTGQPTPTPGVLLVDLRGPGSINYLDLSDPSSGLHYLFTTIRWPGHDIEYDPVDGMVYWTEFDTIGRSHPDGSDVQVLYEPDDYGIDDIYLDVDGRYIYWNNGRNTIYRSHLDGSGQEPAVVAPSGQRIDTITIDTVHRRIYWNTWNGTGAWSSAMDGSQVKNIFADPLYKYGNDLEIDVTRDRLYWVGSNYGDVRGDIICESQTDGQGYRVLVYTDWRTSGFTLDHNSGVIYWVERKYREKNRIYQMTPHDPCSTRKLVYEADKDESIQGIHHVSADAASAIVDV